MKRAVTVYAEVTPNPSTMKFVTDLMLVNGGETVEFLSKAETKNHSLMAESLFDFPFVKSIFIANNFITVTKTEMIEWDLVVRELRDFIKNWIEEKDAIVEKIPVPKERIANDSKSKNETASSEAPKLESEIDRTIYNLLEEYVKPAVESDGGAIDYKSFDEVTGTVSVILRGSCSGCPSSTATLKGGIETLLKSYLPEVQEVVAIEG